MGMQWPGFAHMNTLFREALHHQGGGHLKSHATQSLHFYQYTIIMAARGGDGGSGGGRGGGGGGGSGGGGVVAAVVVVVEVVVVGWLQPKKRRNADKASDSLCPVDVSHIQHEATFHTLKPCDLGSQARVTR